MKTLNLFLLFFFFVQIGSVYGEECSLDNWEETCSFHFDCAKEWPEPENAHPDYTERQGEYHNCHGTVKGRSGRNPQVGGTYKGKFVEGLLVDGYRYKDYGGTKIIHKRKKNVKLSVTRKLINYKDGPFQTINIRTSGYCHGYCGGSNTYLNIFQAPKNKNDNLCFVNGRNICIQTARIKYDKWRKKTCVVKSNNPVSIFDFKNLWSDAVFINYCYPKVSDRHVLNDRFDTIGSYLSYDFKFLLKTKIPTEKKRWHSYSLSRIRRDYQEEHSMWNKTIRENLCNQGDMKYRYRGDRLLVILLLSDKQVALRELIKIAKFHNDKRYKMKDIDSGERGFWSEDLYCWQ